MTCKICNAHAQLFYKELRTFYKCESCSLIFTPCTVDHESQLRHYKSQWGNGKADVTQDLAQKIIILINKYTRPYNILDFGSGSGRLSDELQRRGLNVTPLDPISNGYLKDQSYPYKFNVVVAVEVIEHLLDIWEEITEINKVLSHDGIMIFTTYLTNHFIDRPDARNYFKNWWYKDDPTHLNFFCTRTLVKLAGKIDFKTLDIYGKNAFVLGRL